MTKRFDWRLPSSKKSRLSTRDNAWSHRIGLRIAAGPHDATTRSSDDNYYGKRANLRAARVLAGARRKIVVSRVTNERLSSSRWWSRGWPIPWNAGVGGNHTRRNRTSDKKFHRCETCRPVFSRNAGAIAISRAALSRQQRRSRLPT